MVVIPTAERDFKGVWIPKEVWLDERLSMLDKGILTEIDSLDSGEDGCFASNEHIADFCQCSVTKVSTSISHLVELGYIRVASFDGRKRFLKSSLSKSERQTFKNCKADFQKVKDSNTYNKPPNKPLKSISSESELTGFVEFWKNYPNKVKKSSAIAAWKSGKLESIADKIIADVKLRKDTEWKGQDIHYIPHPTTYIHQRRWEDETVPTERKDTMHRGTDPKDNPALNYQQREYKDEDYGDDFFIDLDKYGED